MIISLSKWVFGASQASNTEKLYQIAIIFILSIASYELIENKIRHRKFNISDFKIIVVGIFSICISGLIIICLYLISLNYKSKSAWDGIIMIHNDYPCHSPKLSSDPIKDCLRPLKENTPHIYILGDSHATNLIPSISAAAPKEYEIRYLGDDKFTMGLITPKKPDEFYARMQFVNAYVKKDDIIFFSMSRDYFYAKDFESGKPRSLEITGQIYLKQLQERLNLFARAIDEKGGKLIIVNNLPKVCSHEQFALQKSLGKINPCISNADESLKDRLPLSEIYKSVASTSNAVIIDPHSYLCPNGVCSSIMDGKIIYWDASPHTVSSYPDLLKDFFKETVFNVNKTVNVLH